MNRRVMREFAQIEALSGANVEKQELIRISEGDDNVCDSCDAKGGEVGTMAYHASIGLPGAASCYGGDMCRCELVLID